MRTTTRGGVPDAILGPEMLHEPDGLLAMVPDPGAAPDPTHSARRAHQHGVQVLLLALRTTAVCQSALADGHVRRTAKPSHSPERDERPEKMCHVYCGALPALWPHCIF